MKKTPKALGNFFSPGLQKIVFAVFIFSILFRVFSIIVVPEPAYNDSVYHLEVAQQLMQGNLPTRETPPFLYHLILAGFFGITGLPAVWPFVKVIPLIVTFLQICIAFLLFKKLFPKSYLVPLIFFASFPWIVRIGSVNMIDSFSVLTILIFAYFACQLAYSKNDSLSLRYAFFTALSFLPMAFSKTNVLFLMPFMLLCFGFLLRKKLDLKKAVPFFVLAALLGASFVLLSVNLPAGEANPFEGGSPPVGALPTPKLDLINPEFFPKSFAVFFDFPHESAFQKMPVLNTLPYAPVLLLFILILLPVGYLLLKGAFISVKGFFGKNHVPSGSKSILFFWLFVTIFFLVSFYPALVIIRESEIYARYLLPSLPFAALLLGAAFEHSKDNLRRIALVSLLLFVFYSFAMTSTSAVVYHDIQQKNQPLYDFLNGSAEINSVVSMHNSRALRYYTDKEVITLSIRNHTIDELLSDYGSKTRFIAISCYNEDILTSMPGILESNRVKVVFESGCTKLLKMIS